jgi:hypothetical protein
MMRDQHMTRPAIATLWIGARLSFLEQLCLKSFVDHGHRVTLYSYGPVDGVPHGVRIAPADDILPAAEVHTHAASGSPAPHADLFRYRMLTRTDEVWVDADMLCMRPWEIGSRAVFGWEKPGRLVCNAVLRLPADSAALSRLVAFCADPHPIPPWYPEAERADLVARRDAGAPVPAGDLRWGVWGPDALTHFLKETGEIADALPQMAFYPVAFRDRRHMLKPGDPVSPQLTAACLGVHLWNRRLRRRIVTHENNRPDPTSFLGRALARHGIDPAGAPIPDEPPPGFPTMAERAAEKATTGSSTSTKERIPLRLARRQDAQPDAPRAAVQFDKLQAAMERLEAASDDRFGRLPDLAEPQTNDRIVVVASVSNEGPYLLEWIAYHRAIGVSHFLIYTHDSKDGTIDILDHLAEQGVLTRISNERPDGRGPSPQYAMLRDCVNQPCFRSAHWVIPMEVTDFIVVHTGSGTLSDLFLAANQPNMISITRRIFGNSGIENIIDSPVIEQFTKCAPEFVASKRFAWAYKTMFRPEIPFTNLASNMPRKIAAGFDGDLRWVNGSGRRMPVDQLDRQASSSSIETVGYRLATMNHYPLRSIDAYLAAHRSGRINAKAANQSLAFWVERNFCTQEDTRILRHMPRLRRDLQRMRAEPGLDDLHKAALAWHQRKAKRLLRDAGYQALRQSIAGSDWPDAFDLPQGASISVEQPRHNAAIGPKDEPTDGPRIKAARTRSMPDALRTMPIAPSADSATAETSIQTAESSIAKRSGWLPAPESEPPSERVLIVTGMKNEAPYILEWVAYHMAIGVTHFLVYTNDCSDTTNSILDRLAQLGFVTRLDNPWKPGGRQKPQLALLRDCSRQQVYKNADWIIPIDVDEFVSIHVGAGTLSDLFKATNYPSMISMTWKFFGNSGIREFRDQPITEQFVRCAPQFLPKPRLGWGFKTMFHNALPFSRPGTHSPRQLDPGFDGDLRWVNGSGCVMPDGFFEGQSWASNKRTIGYRLVTLNHYVLRSAEAYLVKRDRGRINHQQDDQGLYYWVRRNYNSETDTRLRDRAPLMRPLLDRLLADPELARLHAGGVAWHRARSAALLERPDFQRLYAEITQGDWPDPVTLGKEEAIALLRGHPVEGYTRHWFGRVRHES